MSDKVTRLDIEGLEAAWDKCSRPVTWDAAGYPWLYTPISYKDHEFIAGAHNAMPALIAYIRWLEGCNLQLDTERAAWKRWLENADAHLAAAHAVIFGAPDSWPPDAVAAPSGSPASEAQTVDAAKVDGRGQLDREWHEENDAS